MSRLTVTIPHQLTREEVRRRIEEQVQQIDRSPPSGLTLQHQWQGDTLDFRAAAMGQTLTGSVAVQDRDVRVEVDLPWMLSFLGDAVKKHLEARGRELLGHRA